MYYSLVHYWCEQPNPWQLCLSILKEIQPVHPKGDQSWIFTGRTDAEAEAPVLWPPDVKNWLTGKDSDAGQDWGWEKGKTEDDMVVWMASPTRWTWVWVSSGSWWWTGKPGTLQSMRLQRVGHDWGTVLNCTHRKEKLSSSRIHCSYIILSTEFKLSCLLCNHQFLA